MFRRFAGIALAALMAAPAATSAAPVDVRRDTLAYAGWSFPMDKPNHYRWYFAFVWDMDGTTSESKFGIAAIGRGTCVREKLKGGGMSIGCSGTGAVVGTPDKAFDMDPALRSAKLTLRKNGNTHRVKWTASDDDVPNLYLSQEVCGSPDGYADGQGVGGGLVRETRATGTVFGTKVKPKRWWDWSDLWSGAMATQCTFSDEFAELRNAQPGDRISVSETFTR